MTQIPLPTTPGPHAVAIPERHFIQRPDSTKRFIYGPTNVNLYVHPDGGIDLVDADTI